MMKDWGINDAWSNSFEEFSHGWVCDFGSSPNVEEIKKVQVQRPLHDWLIFKRTGGFFNQKIDSS